MNTYYKLLEYQSGSFQENKPTHIVTIQLHLVVFSLMGVKWCYWQEIYILTEMTLFVGIQQSSSQLQFGYSL